MEKFIKITSCSECPFRRFDHGLEESVCTKLSKKFDQDKNTPYILGWSAGIAKSSVVKFE